MCYCAQLRKFHAFAYFYTLQIYISTDFIYTQIQSNKRNLNLPDSVGIRESKSRRTARLFLTKAPVDF